MKRKKSGGSSARQEVLWIRVPEQAIARLTKKEKERKARTYTVDDTGTPNSAEVLVNGLLI